MTLEQYLDNVAVENGFTSVSVGRMPVEERLLYTARVHYKGFARDGIGCSSEHSDHSIQDALHKTIIAATKNRTPLPIMPCVPPSLEIAA